MEAEIIPVSKQNFMKTKTTEKGVRTPTNAIQAIFTRLELVLTLLKKVKFQCLSQLHFITPRRQNVKNCNKTSVRERTMRHSGHNKTHREIQEFQWNTLPLIQWI